MTMDFGLITSKIIVYADDICIISPSLKSLQELLNIFAQEVQLINLNINLNKLYCIIFLNIKNTINKL